MLVCLYKPEEGLSQNNNEALTHLVWDIGPKEKFAGPETVETACPLAVASERVEMNKMKSETAQPMSLKHLDPEFLF